MNALARFLGSVSWNAGIAVAFVFVLSCGAQNPNDAANRQAKEQAAKTFLNADAPKAERLAAAAKLGYPDRETFAKMLDIGKNSQADDEIRWEALRRHPWSKDWVAVVLEILNDPENGGEKLDANLVMDLNRKTIRVPDSEMRQAIQRTYRKLLDDPRESVRQNAYFALVSTEDPVAVTKLVEGLRNGGGESPVPLDRAIELIDIVGATSHFNAVRPYLSHQDPKVQAVAARVLAADANSRPAIESLIANPNAPAAVRAQAIRGMGRFDAGLSMYAIPLIRNRDAPLAVRQAAMEAMVGQVNAKRLEGPVEVNFAEAVEAFSSDPGVEATEKGNQEQAKTLLENLQKTSPAIRRHFDSRR